MSVSRYEALKVLVTSKENGTAVGIRIHGRRNILITTISRITGRSDDDTVIQVNDHSIYGEPIQLTSFSLSDMVNIFNLRIRFNDPFYLHLRSLRDNIRTIR